MHIEIALVAGFGNLGARLLPLSWVYPFVRFVFLERHRETYEGMKAAFQDAGTVEDLQKRYCTKVGGDHPQLKRDVHSKEPNFEENVFAFYKQLSDLKSKFSVAEEQIFAKNLGDLFEQHVYYCGSPASKEPPTAAECERHRKLVRHLMDVDRDEVLLYLATQPQLYLWHLERYAPFSSRVAVDKPLATTHKELSSLQRFARLHPELDIRPIDHYLFKLDFKELNQELQKNPDRLRPRNVRHIKLTLLEESLDEHRSYFRKTGIIRDMMPHVGAMLSYLFRHSGQLQSVIGNISPVLHDYGLGERPTILQATLNLNFWTGDTYIPVEIRLGKGAKPQKELVIHWSTGFRQAIDLTRTVGSAELSVDWAGAFEYLMEDSPTAIADSVKGHFTFERACQITLDVFQCQKQAKSKRDSGVAEIYDKKLHASGPRADAVDSKAHVCNFDGVIVSHYCPAIASGLDDNLFPFKDMNGF